MAMTNPQQPVSPMLEKCARAIADGLGLAYSNGREPDLDESDFADAARACLQALLEVDEETMTSVFEACPWAPPGYNETVIRAAIQSILGEEPLTSPVPQ